MALDTGLEFGDAHSAMLDPITGERAEPILQAKDNRGLPGVFTYYRAASGLVFLDPVPANLGDYYAEGYQQIPKDEAELAEMAKGDAYRLDFLQRLVKPPATFLEIGPWIGLTAYSAKQAGYEVSVLERSPECCALLESCGIDTTQTEDPAETLRTSGKTYDVIAMWHSIEHLPRPWEVIDAAAKALNPGGILLIAAPNPESAQLEVLGPDWLHLDAPRHLHFLPVSMIQRIGEANGLTTVEATTDDPLGRRIDEDGWNWEALRRFNVPVLRRFYRMVVAKRLARKHRKSAMDGAGYTVVMMKDH